MVQLSITLPIRVEKNQANDNLEQQRAENERHAGYEVRMSVGHVEHIAKLIAVGRD